MTLKETLHDDLTSAIRARDTVRAATLRMALTAVTNEEVAGTAHRTLTDADVTGVLTKEAKRRREAAQAYRDARRPELAEAEEAELAILATYLPEQLDDSEIERIVAAAIEQTGASSMREMGQVMKLVQPQVTGRADGGKVAALVRSKLG